MRASYWLSRLGEAQQRRRAIRWLAGIALGGFAVTMVALVATGRGTDRWFFVLVVWLALVYIPLWLLAAAFETLGPALRVRMARSLAGRLDRYGTLPAVAVMVEEHFSRQVVMPRIATAEQGHKAREAAVALVLLANRRPPAVETLYGIVGRCLAAVEAWARDLGEWAASAAPENIQARWGAARALAALAAMSKTLVAVYEDRSGRAPWPDRDGRSPHALLDAALDYCDTLALEVEVSPWDVPPLALAEDPAGTEALRRAWERYVSAPQPAPAPLEAFLAATLPGVPV